MTHGATALFLYIASALVALLRNLNKIRQFTSSLFCRWLMYALVVGDHWQATDLTSREKAKVADMLAVL